MKHIETLKKDKKLAAVLSKVEPYKPRKGKDVYLPLMRAIAGQQLSVKAAATIWQRFLALFPDEYPQAKLVVKMDVEKMRGAGLSYQKAGYMKNIAVFSLEHDMTYEYLSKLNDDDAVEYLSQIKGVGRWTVEMLLMFSLGRKDVFPVDDLGIVNAMKKLYKLSEEGKALKTKCTQIAEQWRPYRSHACFYLWPYKDIK
jgi:DNA-3-methyladenine glycosylase II